MKTINYRDHELSLSVSAYKGSTNIAIVATDVATNEPYCKLTVNIEELEPYHAYIDTNNTYCVNELIRVGLATKTSKTVNSGYCQYPEVIFNKDVLAQYDEKGALLYAEYLKTF